MDKSVIEIGIGGEPRSKSKFENYLNLKHYKGRTVYVVVPRTFLRRKRMEIITGICGATVFMYDSKSVIPYTQVFFSSTQPSGAYWGCVYESAEWS